MNAQRITTLLLFLAVGALGIALFILAACTDPYRGHRGLPANHPDGTSMEIWLQNDGDPPWWPQPCQPKKTLERRPPTSDLRPLISDPLPSVP